MKENYLHFDQSYQEMIKKIKTIQIYLFIVFIK